MRGWFSTFGVAMMGAGLAVSSSFVPPSVSVPAHVVLLAGDTADSPLGDGPALVIGPSGFPIPGQRYVDAADTLYLQPRDFTGTAQGLFTPEGDYPSTGVRSLEFNQAVAQGEQILDSAIENHIAGGHVDAANPVVVFGWSESATIASLTMSQLAAQGVPSDDVHFVLVGDPNNPSGGQLQLFDVPPGTNPTIPFFGTFSGATPDDLFPTDIYTKEYDGFADVPRYPLNLLSDLNALFGTIIVHSTYPVLTPAELIPTTDGGRAILLPGSEALTGEGLTNYYMIPTESLPLLDPLRLIPVVGQPLYDLLEPDTRILVNLGYGSISDGWAAGPANVPTTFGLFPTGLNPAEVLTALGDGLLQGVTDAAKDLQNPDTYRPTPIIDNPVLSELVKAAFTMGIVDTPHPTLGQLLQAEFGGPASQDITTGSHTTLLSLAGELSGALSSVYSGLLPLADTVNVLFTAMPAYDVSLFIDQLEAGNLLGAVGDPIAADVGWIFTIASSLLP
ncbi:PE-PPE domain-containing protein [Mycobacterium sp.]|uniref:PE-PPE domain-containing protein n=1 Tax=Mycobacterium sp. TaxID=1785 RepID=UPI0012739CC4|nr:PE-PPE domain-containing protein [Mycobacterium sp.]KAA8969148.1 MAG: PE-PPE domain-containing protein [Mycobacterium sp.]